MPEPQQGQVIPAAKNEVNLEEVLKVAKPLVDQWTHATVTTAQEETKRIQLHEEGETKRFEMELKAERQPQLFDFLTVMAVILGLFAVIAWAAVAGKDWIVTHGIVLLVGLIGGYGAGRARAGKSDNPDP